MNVITTHGTACARLGRQIAMAQSDLDARQRDLDRAERRLIELRHQTPANPDRIMEVKAMIVRLSAEVDRALADLDVMKDEFRARCGP